jgi:hypothetical protein
MRVDALQVQSLKESGGLERPDIRNSYYNMAGTYGFDRRMFNGW